MQKLAPEEPELAERIAEAYARARRVVEADAELRAAGEQLVRSGQLRRAVPIFRKIAEIDPSDVNSQITLGHLLAETGDRAEAAECSRRIALAFEASGHPEEALAQWRHAVEIAPEAPPLREHFARALSIAGRHEEAVAELRILCRLRPRDPAPLEGLRRELLAAGHDAESDEVATELLELSPENESLSRARADLRLAEGKVEEAFDLLAPLAERSARRGDPLHAALLLAAVADADPPSVRSLRAEVAYLREVVAPAVAERRKEVADLFSSRQADSELADALAAAERGGSDLPEPEEATAAGRYDLVLDVDGATD